MKNFLDFFYYTQTERKACVLLLFLCFTAFVVPEWLDFSQHYNLTSLANAPRPVQAKAAWNKPRQGRYAKGTYRYKPRYPANETKFVASFALFDPNSVSLEELLKMGLNKRCASIWVKYTSKGGHFKKAEDVLKIYGLPKDWFTQAKSYIQIQAKPDLEAGEPEKSGYSSFEGKKFSKKGAQPCVPIDVNTADTAAWQSLRGIGKVLANRIIKFREKLGGFYQVDQIRETFGLADSVYQKIRPCLQLNTPALKPLLINQASFNELASHPYLGFKAAKAIMNWKDQHGPLGKMEDLEELVALEPGKLEKLKPYVQF
ncbi:MAG: helix-hairpin-helix domain-containing protein [Haliscomenobacter sp.]|uniref:helix-hairpin-helix domain-containing protein n=1 Tax=Haliscomenobacter sp. TaxID=2717303 RepID=UPI0029A27D3E|nr:helix-hairpin-helix domain-containing protein [Haliscomenobacter sp.]MDX2068786.1 helix-hairpin-helix domain-containing protein [Haliscomenobacter sp.]